MSAAASYYDQLEQHQPDRAWLTDCLTGLTTDRVRLLVSEWAEQNRYLPPNLSPKPGAWDNSYTPYLVEPMDCLSASHWARKVVVMKGAQIGATTGLLENWIGYTISHDPAPMIMMSADRELIKMAMELRVDLMLQTSNLTQYLQAATTASKKSGDTALLKQFRNGFLLGVGARNPGKMRFVSVKKAGLDELDGMPLVVGGLGKEEGTPTGLIEQRTVAYFGSRKLLYLSTPLRMQTSLIYPLYLAGDQRKYFIPCIHCGHFQILKWHGISEHGHKFGMVYDQSKTGKLEIDSVGYACVECASVFRNHDKTWFLGEGEWRPTKTGKDGQPAESEEDGLTSYHMPSFLSPVGMYPWQGIVQKFLKAWDPATARVRDIQAYQEFRNLEEGEPWEERGETPSPERVREHRRQNYSEGEINQEQIIEETGAPGVLVTTAADVHKDRIDCEVVLWCHHRQSYSLGWYNFEGDTSDLNSPVWAAMQEILARPWLASDGRQYRSEFALIDMGYRASEVQEFCSLYHQGVSPLMGRESSIRGAAIKEFQVGQTAKGQQFFNVTTTIYKNQLAGWLRAEWAPGMLQPTGYPNYPQDRGEEFFAQYQAEEYVPVVNARTKVVTHLRWRQIGQRPNHAWDCRVYNMAALDMIIWQACTGVLQLESVDYAAWANYATPKQNADKLWLVNPYSSHPMQVAA